MKPQPNVDIRLIDYDGMWVPALEGEQSNETGHQDYQNPRRTHRDFHSGIDEFSSAVIQIAISALRREPSLWDKYNNGDNLLFRRRDFVDPRSSALIADLRALDDYKIGEPQQWQGRWPMGYPTFEFRDAARTYGSCRR